MVAGTQGKCDWWHGGHVKFLERESGGGGRLRERGGEVEGGGGREKETKRDRGNCFPNNY